MLWELHITVDNLPGAEENRSFRVIVIFVGVSCSYLPRKYFYLLCLTLALQSSIIAIESPTKEENRGTIAIHRCKSTSTNTGASS